MLLQTYSCLNHYLSEVLQRIQNQAARMLKRITRRNHITPMLRESHWLKIHDRIIIFFKYFWHININQVIIRHHCPEYLRDLVRFNDKGMTVLTGASFDPCLSCVPPISKMYANSLFERSFMPAAPTLLNALDLVYIRLLSFDAYKKSIPWLLCIL